MTAQTKPSGNLTAVTPSDSTEFYATRALLVGTGGTLYVDGADLGVNVKVVIPAGYNPLAVTRVYATGLSGVADITALR